MNRVLIIDDEIRIRRLYRTLLIHEGYQVVDAPDIETANKLIQTDPVDLILLDLKFPHLGGATLYQALKIAYRDIKVIVISGYEVDEQKLLVKGAADYFEKSQSVEDLLTKIKSALSTA